MPGNERHPKRSNLPLAKLAPPAPAHALPRPRLFASIDRALSEYTAIWITGSAGSGKTILAASYVQARQRPALWYRVDSGDADPASFFHYLRAAFRHIAPRRRPPPELGPEYLADLPTFTRNVFRRLASGFQGEPGLLVFDNWHELEPSSPLHELLAVGLEELPDNVGVLLLSRAEPPPPLSALRVKGRMTSLPNNALMMTAEEIQALYELRTGREPAPEVVERLRSITLGWAAGLVLLLDQPQGDMPPETQPLQDRTVLFDYFANEVMDRAEPGLRDFLLRTAWLPVFTRDMVRQVVGRDDVADTLQQLTSGSYFTLQRQGRPVTYEYHPLFAAFLRSQAQSALSEEERREIMARSAQALAEDGQLQHAAGLQAELGQWDELQSLIEHNAPELARSGRFATLAGLLARLPTERLQASPSLAYWEGLSRLWTEPEVARASLARAFRQYEAGGDIAGAALAWSGIVETYLVSWSEFVSIDPWLEAAETVILHARDPLPEPVAARFSLALFLTLMYRRPGDERLKVLAQDAWQLFQTIDDDQLRLFMGSHLLLYFTWWVADFATARILEEQLAARARHAGADPRHKLIHHAARAGLNWMQAENLEAMEAADAGLTLAEEEGIHIWDILIACQGAIAALSENQPERAHNYLERMRLALRPGRYVDTAWYAYLAAQYAEIRGDTVEAMSLLRQGRQEVEKSGIPYFTVAVHDALGRLLVRTGEVTEGTALLESAESLARSVGTPSLIYVNAISRAELACTEAVDESCLIPLRQAFSLARRIGFLNHAWWRGETMARLADVALQHGIEPEHVRALIRKRHLRPPPDLAVPEQWPFPVRITALGALAIERDGKPLAFTTRIPKKPLELLQVLIAAEGGYISEARVAEALWPDADGDLAHQNLRTTLHRLRKVLGPVAITVHDGSIALNREHCWLDLWSLEARLKHLDRDNTPTPPLQDIEALLAIYRGPLLVDSDLPIVLMARERLRNRFLRTIAKIGQRLLDTGACEQALACYQKALEIDPLAESLQAGLLRSHLCLHYTAEGMEAYIRYADLLQSQLGIDPGEELRSLYAQLRAEASKARA